MPSLALKGEDGLGVLVALVQVEFSEVKGFDFHGVSNEFSCGFYFDDGVVGSHVVEEGEVVGFAVDVLDHVG